MGEEDTVTDLCLVHLHPKYIVTFFFVLNLIKKYLYAEMKDQPFVFVEEKAVSQTLHPFPWGRKCRRSRRKEG